MWRQRRHTQHVPGCDLLRQRQLVALPDCGQEPHDPVGQQRNAELECHRYEVNTTDYGGAALGQVAVCSKHPQTIDIALHELGHVFGLADEYEEGLGKYQPPEPASVNVTKKTAGLKWGAMVLPTTAVPTRVNAACRQGPTGPVPKGIIGALEGAKGHECNIYRPSAACKMRDVGDDFCAVCQDHISAKLALYLTNT